MSKFAPMLSAKYDPEAIERLLARGPVLASCKIDGIRAIVRDGRLVSRSLKLIPNEYCQQLFGRPELEGLDGELVVGAPTGNDVMQRTTSGVMRHEGQPDVTFWVFDEVSEQPYVQRLESVRARSGVWPSRIRVLNHFYIGDSYELDVFEVAALADGYEGVMVRDPQGLYKCGRSTAKEGGLIKVKRFEDFEAIVVGYEERMHNDNALEKDELGHAKRSTHKAGKRPAGDLGALVCSNEGLAGDGMTFSIGTGFTAAQRQALWAERETLPGRIVKYRSFAATGVKAAPRFPVFCGWRHPDDL